MTHTCYVCAGNIDPNPNGQIRLEGITEATNEPGRPWVWGPVEVHEDCRLRLSTPYDDRIGADLMSTWEFVPA